MLLSLSKTLTLYIATDNLNTHVLKYKNGQMPVPKYNIHKIFACKNNRLNQLVGLFPKSNKRNKSASTSHGGAGNEIRTRDIKLGKLALYQLSYARISRSI
jgi:hypothetical protein